MIIDTTKIWSSVRATYTYTNKYHLVMMLLATAVIVQGVVTYRMQQQMQRNKIVQDVVNDYNRAYTKYLYWSIGYSLYPNDTVIVNAYQNRADDYHRTEKRLGLLADSLDVVVVIANDTVSHVKQVRDSLAKVQEK